MDIDLILQDNDERLTYEDLVRIKEAIEGLGFYVNDVPTVKRFLSVQKTDDTAERAFQMKRTPVSANGVRMIIECDVCGHASPEGEFYVVEGEQGDAHTYHRIQDGSLHPILMQEGESKTAAIIRGRRIDTNYDIKFRPA